MHYVIPFLQMDRVLDFSAPVNESSDDSTDEPSNSMSGMASQRPRRNRPVSLIFFLFITSLNG